MRGLELKVLSKTHSPQDILKEAQHFFEMQEKLIEVLTESDLSMVKEALIKNLRDPPNSISEEASEVWGYLVNDLPLDWTMQIIEQIEQLELAVVKNTAKNWIFDNNCRRMLTITIGRESSNRLDGDLEALPMNKIYNGIEGVKKLRNEIAFHDEKYLD